MKILMVRTSHDVLGNTGRKTGFWLEEFAAFYFVFRDAGVQSTLASPKGGQPPLDPKSDFPENQTSATTRFKQDPAAQKALPQTANTGTILPSLSSRSLRRSETSMMRRSTAPQRRSTTRITSPSPIHSYRWRLGLAEGEPKYADLEKRLAVGPLVTVPAIALEGDANGAPHYPDPSAFAKKFSGTHAHRTITGGIGHNLPQEGPEAFTKAVVDVDSF